MKVPSQIIFLTGFMGVGKSYWAKVLSKRLNIKMIDLDHAIERSEGRTIARIIKEDGEEAFRALESKWLRYFIDEIHINYN